MNQQVGKKPDIKPFIEQKSSLKKHSESFCSERNRIRITAYSLFPADNGYLTIQTTDCLCHFHNTLIEADAVGYRKGNFWFLNVSLHTSKNSQSKGKGENERGRKGENIYFYNKNIG